MIKKIKLNLTDTKETIKIVKKENIYNDFDFNLLTDDKILVGIENSNIYYNDNLSILMFIHFLINDLSWLRKYEVKKKLSFILYNRNISNLELLKFYRVIKKYVKDT